MANKKSKVFNALYKKAHRGNCIWRFLYSFYTQYTIVR